MSYGTNPEGAVGIKVTPVAASGVSPFILEGTVTYVDYDAEGRIYYCCGRSFPEAIVEVLFASEDAAPSTLRYDHIVNTLIAMFNAYPDKELNKYELDMIIVHNTIRGES